MVPETVLSEAEAEPNSCYLLSEALAYQLSWRVQAQNVVKRLKIRVGDITQ